MNIFQVISICVLLLIVVIIYFMFTHESREKDRVRCPPKHLINKNRPVEKIYIESKKPSETISLYDDNVMINNKGFENELIYKPSMESPKYETMLIQNDEILNDMSCRLSSDLPIGNVNVHYMLKNNTSKIIL